MSAIGEAVLRWLSRDPAAPDDPIEHYEIRHRDFDAMIRSLDEYLPSM